MSERVQGIVVACHRDEWEVALESGEVIHSSLRGRHFVEYTWGDKPIAPGDRVLLEHLPDGSGVINEVLPRETVLSRRLPHSKRAIEQVVVANAEQLDRRRVALRTAAEPQTARSLPRDRRGGGALVGRRAEQDRPLDGRRVPRRRARVRAGRLPRPARVRRRGQGRASSWRPTSPGSSRFWRARAAPGRARF